MSDSTKAIDQDLDRLDIDEIRRFLARRWKLILATALGCVVLAAVVCVTMTPVYVSTAQVLLDPRKQHVFTQEASNPDSALDSSIVDSQIPIILSNRLLAKVIAKEGLANDPEFAAPPHLSLLAHLLSFFQAPRGRSAASPTLDGIDPALAPVILHLFNKVDVSRVAKSYVLSISVSSRDPAKAMRLANALADTYVEDQIDVQTKSVQQTATFFEQRLGRLRDQVRASERDVADFRKANHLTTTSMDGKTTVGEQQLQSLNEELAKVSADTAEALAKYQQGQRFALSGANLETLPEVIRSPVINQLRAQQADLVRRESDLSAMYGPSHPAITQIHAQRAGIDRAINAEMRRLGATLKIDFEVAKAREASFRKTIAALSDASGGDNDIGVKLRELERANLANKALFENFLSRAKLTQEQSAFEEPDARLISPALEPTSPSSPVVKLILPVAGLAGLILGLGLAALLDVRRRKTGVAPVAQQNNAFILARIPTLTGVETGGDIQAYLAAHPGSEFALSIDALVTKLCVGSEDRGRIIALCPLSSGEGATSLALWLAEAAGRAGKRVLLMDADSARRGLSKLTNSTEKPGLSEIVGGSVPASRAVVSRPFFALLPVGRIAFNMATAAKPIQSLLAETRNRFDLVLIDAPAFDASGEAMEIARLADGFALVASRDQLMRDRFIAAIDAVADTPAFTGIILNKTGTAEPVDMAVAS